MERHRINDRFKRLIGPNIQVPSHSQNKVGSLDTGSKSFFGQNLESLGKIRKVDAKDKESWR